MKAKALPLIWINGQVPWQTSSTAVFYDYRHLSLAWLDRFGQSFDLTCH
jgi:hypothetical protein